MTAGDGRGGLTEYAQQPSLWLTASTGQSDMIGHPGVADAYDTTCPATTQYVASDASTSFDASLPKDASASAGGTSDAGIADASTSDVGTSDGGADAGPP